MHWSIWGSIQLHWQHNWSQSLCCGKHFTQRASILINSLLLIMYLIDQFGPWVNWSIILIYFFFFFLWCGIKWGAICSGCLVVVLSVLLQWVSNWSAYPLWFHRWWFMKSCHYDINAKQAEISVCVSEQRQDSSTALIVGSGWNDKQSVWVVLLLCFLCDWLRADRALSLHLRPADGLQGHWSSASVR